MAQATGIPEKPLAHVLDIEQRGILHQVRYVGKLLARDKSGVVGLTIFLALIISAIFAPLIAPHDPLKQNLAVARTPPAWTEDGLSEYILGTDNLGRDIFSRLVYGARVSLTVGFFGVLIASGLGLVIGLFAGYTGGRVDNVITGFVNLVLALPYLLFVVVIAAILGNSLINVILIFGFTDAPVFARVTRGEVLRMRETGFVESAKSVGVKTRGILFSHITPNLLGPIVTLATFEMSAMIFYEAGLSFLGLSVPPSVPSWGNMLANGRKYLVAYPWIATFPGLAIMITSLGINLFGDWLRDVLDPRLRRIKK